MSRDSREDYARTKPTYLKDAPMPRIMVVVRGDAGSVSVANRGVPL